MNQNPIAERDTLRANGLETHHQAVPQEDVYPLTLHQLPIYRVRAFEAWPMLRHAIFTRHRGYSRQPFHSLNFSVTVGDDPQTVQQNFLLACQSLKVRPEQTISTRLVHGAEVLVVDRPGSEHFIDQADGLVTSTPGLYLFMRFGDCAPLLFFDPIRRAVGLTHAGWRGTMQDVAGATVRQMTAHFGSNPADLVAAIGPAIGLCCYEVGPEVIQATHQTFDEPDGLLSYRPGRRNRAYFDLESANARQLAAAGVKHVIKTGLCTACRRAEFFSHRAEQGQTGRFGVLIGLDQVQS